jgi:hypothetical protein
MISLDDMCICALIEIGYENPVKKFCFRDVRLFTYNVHVQLTIDFRPKQVDFHYVVTEFSAAIFSALVYMPGTV